MYTKIHQKKSTKIHQKKEFSLEKMSIYIAGRAIRMYKIRNSNNLKDICKNCHNVLVVEAEAAAVSKQMYLKEIRSYAMS